ncbi:hypothetical protein SR870_11130 [Rhodopseudomonas palustris]|uniref:hypothetical protein n=1 Tax=Rhodopseudomonas palustris TaxID=1076 RepID=UPI002ACD9815|nr:hypothetical protein [Rhodopseudomonas palustris]WQH01787.1 hypothetical protein SR870_11130 [Rhodopseudomonas palustris]
MIERLTYLQSVADRCRAVAAAAAPNPAERLILLAIKLEAMKRDQSAPQPPHGK